MPGYQGRYNFHHPFWVTKDSRLYPPVPHVGLNISQNLAYDIRRWFDSPQHHLLPELLQPPLTAVAERVLRALIWYNRANALSSDDSNSIIDLAVAFETLLALPKDAKTDRFVDAVSLLIGRITRLNLWAEQFYGARSEVAHEGITERLHFMPAQQKNAPDGPAYHSLLAYGRQIFQLCVGTLLFGAHLGARAGLREKLVSNQERFQLICKTLDDKSLTIMDRFSAIGETVALTNEYRYVRETGLLIETLVGAVQRAAKNLLACGESLEPALKKRVEDLAGSQRSPDSYEALAALQALNDLKIAEPANLQSAQSIVRRLADVVWHYTFMHYYWLKERRDKDSQPG